jgi:hypothetical protein
VGNGTPEGGRKNVKGNRRHWIQASKRVHGLVGMRDIGSIGMASIK